jgi:hypothetical protein
MGDILYLTTCVIQADIEAVTTMPDTPSQYSATLKIMSDSGGWDLTNVQGAAGPDGQALFALRDQQDPLITESSQLPLNLSDSREDIGKYWLINSYDQFGHIDDVTAWVWWGTEYRTFMMGTFGPPGPTPQIELSVVDIEPTVPPSNNSFVYTSGSTQNPIWQFNVAAPAGPSGPARPLAIFPDVNEYSFPPVQGSVLAYGGAYDGNTPVWGPIVFDQSPLGPFSMPESAFIAYNGVSQQAPIGSYVLPPQPFPWTPVVWGHIGGSGINLTSSPYMIGCEVLLGDPIDGTLISRGIGTTLGVVQIFPHYSSSAATAAAITPKNGVGVIPANHTTASDGTIYVNLWNDGALGAYTFGPTDAQIMIMVVPIDPTFTTVTKPG